MTDYRHTLIPTTVIECPIMACPWEYPYKGFEEAPLAGQRAMDHLETHSVEEFARTIRELRNHIYQLKADLAARGNPDA